MSMPEPIAQSLDRQVQEHTGRLDDRQLETLYAVGYNFYQHGHIERAAEVFRVLLLDAPTHRKAWFALGACMEASSRYEEAAVFYTFATLLDVADPRAPLHAGECFLQSGHTEEGLSALTAAHRIALTSGLYPREAERAAALLHASREGGVR